MRSQIRKCPPNPQMPSMNIVHMHSSAAENVFSFDIFHLSKRSCFIDPIAFLTDATMSIKAILMIIGETPPPLILLLLKIGFILPFIGFCIGSGYIFIPYWGFFCFSLGCSQNLKAKNRHFYSTGFKSQSEIVT